MAPNRTNWPKPADWAPEGIPGAAKITENPGGPQRHNISLEGRSGDSPAPKRRRRRGEFTLEPACVARIAVASAFRLRHATIPVPDLELLAAVVEIGRRAKYDLYLLVRFDRVTVILVGNSRPGSKIG